MKTESPLKGFPLFTPVGRREIVARLNGLNLTPPMDLLENSGRNHFFRREEGFVADFDALDLLMQRSADAIALCDRAEKYLSCMLDRLGPMGEGQLPAHFTHGSGADLWADLKAAREKAGRPELIPYDRPGR